MTNIPSLSFANVEPEQLEIDHQADVDPVAGAAVVSIPLRLSGGRDGFGPRLSLSYTSSGANSLFGVGWVLLGTLSIAIDTRRGVPRYDESDHYTFTGGGALVPADRLEAGVWRPRVEDRRAFWVRIFRPRVESAFIRIERWTEKATGRVHWRTRDVRNTLTIYGLDPGGLSRIADPADPMRTFAWLPEAQYDPLGNAIVYDYAAETRDGIDFGLGAEWARLAAGTGLTQRYLKRIRYGNSRPVLADAPVPIDNHWLFEVVFDYGDHRLDQPPTPVSDHSWPARPDPFSSYRPGFEVRTYRLCRRVLMFHRFEALGPGATLVGAYRLEHALDPTGSRLEGVHFTGFRRDAETGAINERSLPPLHFTYSQPAAARAFTPALGQTIENVPQGLTGASYRWLDLYGEGLPGILTETGDAWYFKLNEGGGAFGPQRPVVARPAYRLGQTALADFDGDGNGDLVVFHGRDAGYYEYDREADAWAGFRPFDRLPHLEAAGAKAQWLDLDGDGRSDLLLSDPERIVWYPLAGKEGFGAPVELQRPKSAETPPIAENGAIAFFFADMTGDGLLDQVRVGNGRVEYWPNLGHGRFGDPVPMVDAGLLATEGAFDASRLLFVDLDGDGAADLVYIGRGEIRTWINAEGNRLIEGFRLSGLPIIDGLSTARVLDFLGNGTPTLVWSSPLAGRAVSIHYLPLTGCVRPNLLLAVDNSMGREVAFTYSSSASHYLRAKRVGQPWHTRLPSHVMVVDRREVRDLIGGSRAISRFEYYDGHFDGPEQTFRGFGRVDQFDAELHNDGTGLETAHTTPSCLRTWRHLGRADVGSPPDRYLGDPLQPIITPQSIDDVGALLPEEYQDALRALAGRVVREELFALNAEGRQAEHPFQTVQYGYQVRRLQPSRDHQPASFFGFRTETLTHDYEQDGADPRAGHEFALETDDYGNVLLEATVAYARRPGIPAATPAQTRPVIRCTAESFLNIDQPDRYETGIAIETREFEVRGPTLGTTGAIDPAALQSQLQAATSAPLAFDQDFAGAGVQARLISWDRTFYRSDVVDLALPFGSVGGPALVHQTEQACFTTALIEQAFGDLVDAPMLTGDGGYFERDGYWWRASDVRDYRPASEFFRLSRLVRADGGEISFEYDESALAARETRDPLGNRIRGDIDYHLVAPFRLIDPNDNVAEVLYDPLGVGIVTTLHGEVLDTAGDPQAYGQDPLSAYVSRPTATWAQVIADPAFYLQTASRFLHYDLEAWRNEAAPLQIVRLEREGLTRDGTGAAPGASRTQINIAYIDGFRRTLQSKTLVEPGPAIESAVALRAAAVQPAPPPRPERAPIARASASWPREIFHALVLDMHQPAGNLEQLLSTNEWEAKEILFAYDRMARFLQSNGDLARVNTAFSGTLLETLSNPDFQKRAYGIVKCGDLLNDLQELQSRRVLEVLPTGYYHPLFALIPEADWDEQIRRGLDSARHFFPHGQSGGFWPPDLAFDMRLIPHLTQAGFHYVIVDDEYVRPIDQDMPWPVQRYRPHIAEYDGSKIIVIVRDRDLSKAQLAGMEHDWFQGELLQRIKDWHRFQDWHHGLPPLATTATPGENGGWFRNVDDKANFWGHFYRPTLEGIRFGLSLVRPTLISQYLDRFFNEDYLRQFGDAPTVTIECGAWNTEEHHGCDFSQWQGSQAQCDAMARLHEVSAAFHRLAPSLSADMRTEAQWRILRAECGCNFFWGDACLCNMHTDLDVAEQLLGLLPGRSRDVHLAWQPTRGGGGSAGLRESVPTASAIESAEATLLSSEAAQFAAQRWLVTGHTVYNQKQQPVRQYEPFHSAIPDYEPEAALVQAGVFHQFLYDAVGRLIREELPNGTHTRTEISAWSLRHFDANDTVATSFYRVAREGLSADNPERRALEKALVHADTPVVTDLDPRGIAVRQVEMAPDGNHRITENQLDIRGESIAFVDARGLTAFRNLFDMQGSILLAHSIDAGDIRTLFDQFDRPVHVWDGSGVHQRRRFDQLDRPVSTTVDGALGLHHTTEELIYGEDATVDQAVLRNARGRLVLHRDQAGTLVIQRYAPSGGVLASERRFRESHLGEPDWPSPTGVALDPVAHVSENSYDALGRVVRQHLPDGTTRSYTYLQGGGLDQVTLTSDDGLVTDAVLFEGSSFNARGQRLSARLGNGVEIAHTYDPETFRTQQITALRSPQAAGESPVMLQDIEYTYDPVGNITRSFDHAQAPAGPGEVIQGLNVSPEAEFTYDAFYQLTRATGRVHQALLQHDYRPDALATGTVKGTRHLNRNNGAAVERYTRTYAYDPAGNLQSVAHVGTTRSWTTDLWTSAGSNRGLPALNPDGLPITDPEAHFDASGNCVRLAHLRRLDWTYRNAIARAVVIDRSAEGRPDDAEYYLYDGGGLRVRKLSERLVGDAVETTETLYLDGCEIRRIRSGENPILERITSHIGDGINRIALVHRWTRDDRARETDDVGRARVRYQLSNHLGSSQLDLDEQGGVISYEEYFPFGGTSFIAGDSIREVRLKDYRFCGKERDDGTGLYYFEHRYYAPWIGKWLSPDPAGPESDVNLYRYVFNNPINFIDPDGLDPRRPGSRGRTYPTRYVTFSELQAAVPAEHRAALDPRTRYTGVVVPERTEPFQANASGQELRAFLARQRGAEIIIYDPRYQDYLERGLDPQAARELTETLQTLDEALRPLQPPPPEGQEGGGAAGGGGTGTGGTGTGTGGAEQPAGGEHGEDGTGGGARGADGAPADSDGRGTSQDSGGTGTHAADGSGTATTPGSGGTGRDGIGAGAGAQGRGRGGGGTAAEPGIGTSIQPGRGTGPGAGGGTGAGTGTGTRPGEGTGGSGRAPGGLGAGTRAGTSGGVPGGVEGGVPGGVPGGVVGGSLGGARDGSLNGIEGGSPKGVPAPPGQTVNGDDPNGSRTGTGAGGGGAGGTGTTAGGGQGGVTQGQAGGQVGGAAQGQPGGAPQGQAGGPPGGQPGQQPTTMDRIVRYAGYWNLEFGGEEGGESGGIPGGMGPFNLGAWGQAAYAALTIVDVILTVVTIGGAFAAKGALRAALKGLVAGGRRALRATASVFTRQFWRTALRRVGRFFYDPRPWWRISREYWAGRGPAAGRSLHHWLIPRRWRWVPEGIRNAGFNLLELPRLINFPGGLNTWMGFAARWGGWRAFAAHAIENGIRVAIPGSLIGGGYVGYRIGDRLSHDQDRGPDLPTDPRRMQPQPALTPSDP